jgi:glycine oxidase
VKSRPAGPPLPLPHCSDVVIVGGGVIGLSVAYALSNEGATSTVLDAGEIGRAASWAGAGMIPPFTRRLNHGPMIALRSAGAVLYREWSAALREETGIDNGYRVTGGVDVAATALDESDLRTAAGRWRVEGIAFERLSPEDFPRVEPALNPSLLGGYFLPDRAQIRNPRHLKALKAALEIRGVTLRPQTPLLGFERDGDRVVGLRVESGSIPCGQVVMAAGTWSGGLLEGLGARVPTAPLRGQIVMLRGDRPRLGRIIEHGKNYLVPRDDGRILIGASEEDRGFDTRPTPEVARALIDEAVSLCPVLAEAEVERTWAGLRPGSVDTRPYIGRLPGWSNVVIATGHKRAGLQLAPSTAEVVADLILGRPPRIDLGPFAPGRPAGPPDDPAFRS